MTRRAPSEYAGKTVKIRASATAIGGQEFRVEDWWQNVSGESWAFCQAPAAYQYAVRTAGDTPVDDEVLYGKVGSFGFLVHVSEIEAIRAQEAGHPEGAGGGMKPNAQLAYMVLDHIDAHPEQWDQGHWVGQADCGTVGCFAGWAVMLSGYTVDDAIVIESPDGAPDLNGLHIETASDRLLGISDETAAEHGDPYDGLLKRDELGQRVPEIFGPRPAAGDAS